MKCRSTATIRRRPRGRTRWIDALRRLPERQRHVLAVRVLLDLDTAQTAELLGLKPATVRVHLHRAALKLRAELGATTRSEDRR